MSSLKQLPQAVNFVRHVTKTIQSLPIDDLQISRLQDYVTTPKDVLVGLERANQVHRMIQRLPNDNGDAAFGLLEIALKHSVPDKLRMPEWLYEFTQMPTSRAKQRQRLFEVYGSLGRFHHLIDSINVDEALLKKYNDQLVSYQKTLHPGMPAIGQVLSGELDGEVQGRSKVTRLLESTDPSIELIRKLNLAYESNRIAETSVPEFTFRLAPNAFGQPVPLCRMRNMVINALINTQNLYIKYKSVSKTDLYYLNRLDSDFIESCPVLFRNAYRKLISTSFVITPDAEIVRANDLSKPPPANDSIVQYYSLF